MKHVNHWSLEVLVDGLRYVCKARQAVFTCLQERLDRLLQTARPGQATTLTVDFLITKWDNGHTLVNGLIVC